MENDTNSRQSFEETKPNHHIINCSSNSAGIILPVVVDVVGVEEDYHPTSMNAFQPNPLDQCLNSNSYDLQSHGESKSPKKVKIWANLLWFPQKAKNVFFLWKEQFLLISKGPLKGMLILVFEKLCNR